MKNKSVLIVVLVIVLVAIGYFVMQSNTKNTDQAGAAALSKTAANVSKSYNSTQVSVVPKGPIYIAKSIGGKTATVISVPNKVLSSDVDKKFKSMLFNNGSLSTASQINSATGYLAQVLSGSSVDPQVMCVTVTSPQCWAEPPQIQYYTTCTDGSWEVQTQQVSMEVCQSAE